MYAKDDKLFAKYSKDKFKLTKASVSPFVNQSALHKQMIAQKEAFESRMKAIEKESSFFNMIFKEIDEDDSEEGDTNI